MTDHVGTFSLTLDDPASLDALLLVRELSAELGPIYGDDGSGAFLPADVQVPRAAFVVARLDGQPVGCGAIRPFGDGPAPIIAEIKRMFVRADVRGRGVAQAVLERLEQEARGFGYTRLVLETGDKQLAAIRLYERAGYARIPCYGEYAGRSFSICYGRDL
jgi:putative acetyltransferase